VKLDRSTHRGNRAVAIGSSGRQHLLRLGRGFYISLPVLLFLGRGCYISLPLLLFHLRVQLLKPKYLGRLYDAVSGTVLRLQNALSVQLLVKFQLFSHHNEQCLDNYSSTALNLRVNRPWFSSVIFTVA